MVILNGTQVNWIIVTGAPSRDHKYEHIRIELVLTSLFCEHSLMSISTHFFNEPVTLTFGA